MFKKAQAAMEFLMTYGWAILVVLAAIGALAYFGVLSPDNLLPERTSFQAPLPNIDTADISTTGKFVIAFSNSVGYKIDILNTGANITAIEAAGADVNDCGTVTVPSPPTGIKNGDTFLVTVQCGGGMAPWTLADRVKATVTFQYNNTYTGQTRSHTGIVNGKVSSS